MVSVSSWVAAAGGPGRWGGFGGLSAAAAAIGTTSAAARAATAITGVERAARTMTGLLAGEFRDAHHITFRTTATPPGTVLSVELGVLGGSGAWPGPGGACSGYLLVHDGFRLLVDPGYAVLPWLLEEVRATQVDAVFVSHGHLDHCADLNPLLRAHLLPGTDVASAPAAAASEFSGRIDVATPALVVEV